MSKKIAEGIDALVLDVKTGSGAFMKTKPIRAGSPSRSSRSATPRREDRSDHHRDGRAARPRVGNALEVIECFEVLKGGGPPDLIEVSVELTARMLVLGKVAGDFAAADAQVRRAIASGAGLERFRQIIEIQGGDPEVVDDYGRMPHVADRTRRARAGPVRDAARRRAGRPRVGRARRRARPRRGSGRSGGRHHGASRSRASGARRRSVLELHYRDRRRLETRSR
jgi:hypothetical protein